MSGDEDRDGYEPRKPLAPPAESYRRADAALTAAAEHIDQSGDRLAFSVDMLRLAVLALDQSTAVLFQHGWGHEAAEADKAMRRILEEIDS